MAGGMNKRGAGIPMHQRVALSRRSPELPAEPPPRDPAGRAARDTTGRHCWVLAPADGSGERRPGLLVEWRRSEDGTWLGRVVYVVRLRTGNCALIDEWVPAGDLSPP